MTALPPDQTIGRDLRALRKMRGLTLSTLATTLGCSVGWLSQVERDKSKASIEDLQRITSALDVPLSLLFGQPAARASEEGYIVRKGARRPIGHNATGLVEELLSPDLTDDFELVHSTFAPGAALTEPVCRPTQEVGVIIDGRLDLTINDRTHHLAAGDSFRVRGEPYLWSNPYPQPCTAIWAIAPPVY